MIAKDKDRVTITINAGDLIASMALLKELKEFCEKQTEDGVTDTVDALTTAIETMTAFYCEHFEEMEGELEE